MSMFTSINMYTSMYVKYNIM